MAHKQAKFQSKREDVVIMHNLRTRIAENGPWQFLKETYPGKDGVVKAVRVKIPNETLEKAVQQLYSLELKCDVTEKDFQVACAQKFQTKIDLFCAASKHGMMLLICKNFIKNDA